MICLSIVCDGCHARYDQRDGRVYGHVLRAEAAALGWAVAVAQPLLPRGTGTRDYCRACATVGWCSEDAEP